MIAVLKLCLPPKTSSSVSFTRGVDYMEETIRIRSVDKNEWSKTLQGFQPDNIQQVLEVYGVDGAVMGRICESVEGRYYINGQPEMDYASLQAAAGALIKSES
jgi:hypothetical protein